MRRALIVLAAFLAGSLSLGTFARDAAEPAPAAGAGKWLPGKHYKLVPEPQPTSVEAGKVEVLEVFWYGCGHCYALDPVLEGWKANKPANVEFVRVPVIWGPMHRRHAKLFYTLQALRKPELHSLVFDTIHQQGAWLASENEVESRAMQFGFLSQHGVTEQQFDAAYDSMTVAMNMQRAENLTRAFKVASVPLVFINGKFATSVSEAGGDAQLIALINDLAAAEDKR